MAGPRGQVSRVGGAVVVALDPIYNQLTCQSCLVDVFQETFLLVSVHSTSGLRLLSFALIKKRLIKAN